MADIRLHLDAWQEEALSEMARSRGVEVETIAKSLLSERLVEQIHCAFDDLTGEPALSAETVRRDDVRRDDYPCRDTIEQRLKRLFAD